MKHEGIDNGEHKKTMLLLPVLVVEPDEFRRRNNGEEMKAAPRDCAAPSDRRRLTAVVKRRHPIGLFLRDTLFVINYARSPLNLNDLQKSTPSPRHVTSCTAPDFYRAS